MSPDKRERVIDRLLKLWRVTVENNATPAEAELAVTRMRKMMAEYQLSIADLEAEEARRGRATRITLTHRAAYTRKGTLARYDGLCGRAASVLTTTEVFIDNWYTEHHERMQSMSFIGTDEEVEIATQLFHSFLSQARFYARLKFGGGKNTWNKQHTSFCMGFGTALVERATEWKSILPPDKHAQYAMILADKTDAITSYKEQYLQLRTVKARKMCLDPFAFYEGKKRGNLTDLEVGGRLPGSK